VGRREVGGLDEEREGRRRGLKGRRKKGMVGKRREEEEGRRWRMEGGGIVGFDDGVGVCADGSLVRFWK